MLKVWFSATLRVAAAAPAAPRAGEGHAVVAFVRRLEVQGQGRIDAGVRQRGVAEGLRGVGVIVEVEVARRVDARFAVGQVQGQGLALRDVARQTLSQGTYVLRAKVARPFGAVLLTYSCSLLGLFGAELHR